MVLIVVYIYDFNASHLVREGNTFSLFSLAVCILRACLWIVCRVCRSFKFECRFGRILMKMITTLN